MLQLSRLTDKASHLLLCGGSILLHDSHGRLRRSTQATCTIYLGHGVRCMSCMFDGKRAKSRISSVLLEKVP